MRHRSAIVIVSLAVAGATNAAFIDFDDQPSGTIITDQYQSLGVIFSNHLVVVGPSPTTNAVSAPNSVAFYNPANLMSNYTVRADFVLPGTSTTAVTDFVAFTPTDASNQGTQFILSAYNSGGVFITSASRLVDSSGTYNPAVDTEVSVSAPGIAYVEMTVFHTFGNRVIEGDDFRFNEPVPAPATLPAVLGSLLLAGARRRTAQR